MHLNARMLINTCIVTIEALFVVFVMRFGARDRTFGELSTWHLHNDSALTHYHTPNPGFLSQAPSPTGPTGTAIPDYGCVWLLVFPKAEVASWFESREGMLKMRLATFLPIQKRTSGSASNNRGVAGLSVSSQKGAISKEIRVPTHKVTTIILFPVQRSDTFLTDLMYTLTRWVLLILCIHALSDITASKHPFKYYLLLSSSEYRIILLER